MHHKGAGSTLRDGPMPKAEATISVLTVTKMMPELRETLKNSAPSILDHAKLIT
jgi:hypothetical protein